MATTEITYKEIRELFLKKRKRDANKGDFGRVLIIAGSKGMAGAAALCAKGALRAGAGLVTLSVPDEILPIVQTAVPEATCVSRDFTPEQLAVFGAVAIGPGLGLTDESRETVFYILENYGGKIVLDADALTLLTGTNITLDADTIITPHPGEAARLLDRDIEEIKKNRLNSCKELSVKTGAIAVLKGPSTIVSDGFNSFINTTGNSGLATAGSGDVLSGIIGSFMNLNIPSIDAAIAGVYIHGLCADLYKEIYPAMTMKSSDIIEFIKRALSK
jgi:NAD(P)H-hydrate epimerase